MKMIELLSEHIENELEDACTYANLALEYKDTEPEIASLFNELSQEEMTHMEALHKRVISCIAKYNQANGDAPVGMKTLYDFVHKREIKKAEEVINLQNLYRK